MTTTMRGGRRGRAAACATAALGMASMWSVGAGAAQTSSPALTLIRKSMTALGHAPTVVLSGYVQNGNKRMGLLVRSTDHGREASGRMALGSQAFFFVKIGTTYYLDANRPFWKANASHPAPPAAALQALAGRWLRMPKSGSKGSMSGLAALTTPAKLASSFLHGGVSKAAHLGPVTQVHGTAARTIVADGGRIAIAANGAPLPLELVGPKGSGDVLTFAYPKSLHITAPQGAITVTQAIAGAKSQPSSASSLRYRASFAHFSADFPAKPQKKSFPASFANYHMQVHFAFAKSTRGPVEVGEEDIAPALPNNQVKPALVAALRSFATSGLTLTAQPAATRYRSYEAYVAVYSGGGHTLRVMSFMASNARLYLLVGPMDSFSALTASFRMTS